jgi:hypothetical protein
MKYLKNLLKFKESLLPKQESKQEKMNESYSKEDIKDVFIWFSDNRYKLDVIGYGKGLQIKINHKRDLKYLKDFSKIAELSIEATSEYYECINRLIDMGYNIQSQDIKISQTLEYFSLESEVLIRLNKKLV